MIYIQWQNHQGMATYTTCHHEPTAYRIRSDLTQKKAPTFDVSKNIIDIIEDF